LKLALEKKNQASLLEKQFAKKQLLAEAEKAYWKLSLAREAVKINEELLLRSGKLHDWMKEKIDLNLMDKDDILLANSDLKYRELELVNAKDEEKSAARTLNALKGINSESVAEEILLPEESSFKTAARGEKAIRADVEALRLNIEAGKASAEMKAEGVKPELSLSGAASLNSQAVGLSDTLSGSFNTDHVVYGVNLNLSVPLDISERGKLIDGYRAEAKAGEKYLSQKQLEAEVEYRELVRRQEEVFKRLKLLSELEVLQKRKADSEQEKLKKGNTVTYQVLMYEQDWAKSRLGVIQAKQGLVEIMARLRLY
jgi:outer membrane protein TolC